MIVTQPKPFEAITKKLDSVAARDVLIVGCGGCATTSGTGGASEVAALAEKLGESGYTVVGTVVPDNACNVGIVKAALRGLDIDPDATVVLSCGSGVQVVADVEEDVPTLSGLNTMFLGNSLRVGSYEQRCMMCGSCSLSETGGICIKTLCPKGIANGPCGGMWDGNCEVLENHECVHVTMYNRLEKQGRVGNNVRAARNHGANPIPRSYTSRVRGER